ncbi:unnamed protein product [Onchocerca flexuosa]|uniref:BHLH domain-containing protein n=1 Tax=Onchocerca flexuosa TaxID=387005 RepID=A0A183I7Y9_9BILA|nr:unnamed protein product [Onchocerca flexuosa]
MPNSNKRPQTLASSTKCQRPPPIYDRVACCYADNSDNFEDLNLNSSNRLTLAYGKPCTSAGTTPVTSTANNNLTCSASALTQNSAKCQVRQPSHESPVEHARDATERERRTQTVKKFAESWESLNSATSSSDPTSNEQFRHQHHPKTAQGRHSITSRSTILCFFFSYI